MKALQVTRSAQNTADSKTVWFPQYVAVGLFRLSVRLRRKAVNAGEIADYVSWVEQVFGKTRFLGTRERLWDLLAQRVTKREVHGMEFGVAFGYGTDWWLKRLPGDGLRWDGFDRFTGLPRSWRGLETGAFDAGGSPPSIDDDRVIWHVGDVEDHLKDLVLERSEPMQLVVLFDLDIFEPSLVAWQHLRGSLRAGDLLYFDEAFDADERRLLNEYVIPSGEYECVGATPTALGLQVLAMNPI